MPEFTESEFRAWLERQGALGEALQAAADEVEALRADSTALIAEVRRLRALIVEGVEAIRYLASERDQYDLQESGTTATLVNLEREVK